MAEQHEMEALVFKLRKNRNLTDDELILLIESPEAQDALRTHAAEVRDAIYGNSIYVRGLIEFTNYCKNDCFYCGIRRSNQELERYRLSKDEILNCCSEGYALGFRTFVLQGGEDPKITDAFLCETVSSIKQSYPDCAVTLSCGEKSEQSYKAYFKAGADRYLLRHETADEGHYAKLHPQTMSLTARKENLWQLKKIGFEVGSGFMVGSPFQTTQDLLKDLRFLQELDPDMIGIGPYLPHQATPFREMPKGDLQQCLRMISILRLLFPKALIPSTTALGTIHPKGREFGIEAGANVVMPNLSPIMVRKRYELYDNKICTGEEAAECRSCLNRRMETIGHRIVVDIGNKAL